MKKLLFIILSVLLLVFLFGSCSAGLANTELSVFLNNDAGSSEDPSPDLYASSDETGSPGDISRDDDNKTAENTEDSKKQPDAKSDDAVVPQANTGPAEAINNLILDRAEKTLTLRSSQSAPDKETTGKQKRVSSATVSRGSQSLYGNLVLVNKWNPLPASYIPDGLTGTLDKNKRQLFPCKTSSVKLEKEVLDAYAAMHADAQKRGIKDIIVSNGYRSFSLQNYYYNKKVNYYLKSLNKSAAEKKAAEIVAPPGKSEHQTGLALDITTRSLMKTSQQLVEALARTPEGKWISENSWKYGFVVRYRSDKKQITGIISEPWHLRYVGKPNAEIMYKNNQCLEEYLDYIKEKKCLSYKNNSGSTYEIYYITLPSSVQTLVVEYNDGMACDISKSGENGYIVVRQVD